MFHFLENQDACALGEKKAVAIQVKGPRRLGRRVVARGQSAHGAEATHPSGVTTASVPPQIITSTSSRWMARYASPMALAPLEQADTWA